MPTQMRLQKPLIMTQDPKRWFSLSCNLPSNLISLQQMHFHFMILLHFITLAQRKRGDYLEVGCHARATKAKLSKRKQHSRSLDLVPVTAVQDALGAHGLYSNKTAAGQTLFLTSCHR